jgi:peptidoglycan hydrolase CwlO-like protein
MPESNGTPTWISKNWLKLVSILIVIAMGYAVLQYQVGENKDDIEKHSMELDGIKTNQIIFAEDVEHINEDLEDIGSDIETLAEEQQESHDLLVRVGSAVGVEP